MRRKREQRSVHRIESAANGFLCATQPRIAESHRFAPRLCLTASRTQTRHRCAATRESRPHSVHSGGRLSAPGRPSSDLVVDLRPCGSCEQAISDRWRQSRERCVLLSRVAEQVLPPVARDVHFPTAWAAGRRASDVHVACTERESGRAEDASKRGICLHDAPPEGAGRRYGFLLQSAGEAQSGTPCAGRSSHSRPAVHQWAGAAVDETG